MTIEFAPKKVCKTPHSFSVRVTFADYNGDANSFLELGLFNNKGKSIRPAELDLKELLSVLESIKKTENLELVEKYNLNWHSDDEELMPLHNYEIYYTDESFKTYPVEIIKGIL